MHREARERFLREGYAANTVDHPGAVAVLDDDTVEDGSPYLVMERLDGDEVDRLAERRGGRLPVSAVFALADGLLDVLQAAHAKSIVHRDIKPANLYITRDGTLKVLDFGIARVRDIATGGATATKTGVMLGTPSFMAPEQALSRTNEIDGRTDLWSVGATLFYLLTGTFVHDGGTVTEVIVQAATSPARPLAAVLPGVDPRIAAVVDRALAFDKAARWPDAASMRAAVRSTYQDVFGTRITREPLEALLSEEVSGTAGTMVAPSVPMPSVAAAVSAPSLAAVTAPPSAAYPPPPSLDPRTMSAPPVAVSQGPWQAPGPLLGAAPPPPPFVAASPKRSSPSAAAIVGVTVLACAALGGGALFILSGSRAHPAAAPSASADPADPPVAAATASAAPLADTAVPARTADEPAVEPSATPSSAPVIAPGPVAPSRAAPPAVTPARPASTPAPTPTYTPPPPPPPPTREQCADTARACKGVCKQQGLAFRDRHQCLKSCETTEKACRAGASR
jgi:serine/threonine-protein kinase